MGGRELGQGGGTIEREHILIPEVPPDFEDERGLIHNVLTLHHDAIKHVAIITQKRGAVRGNHYHPDQKQYIYILEGILESWSTHVDDPLHQIHRMCAQKGALLYCPPRVAHVYRALRDCTFLNLDTGIRGNMGEDTITWAVLG